MEISDFIGKTIDVPIRSNNAVGDVRTLWHKPQNQRLKGQMLRATDGTTMPYTLLYYIPGLTTFCGIRGIPVLTGYMSGCYLFRYRRRGVLCAAHVGTDLDNAEWNRHAKETWKSYVDRPHITDVFGFDPLKDVSMALLQRAQSVGHTPQVIGIWEGNGAARIGVVASSRTQPGKMILVGIEHAPLRPWAAIRNDPKMR